MASESSSTTTIQSSDEEIDVQGQVRGRCRNRGRGRGVRGRGRGGRGRGRGGRGRGRGGGPSRDEVALDQINRRSEVLREHISIMEVDELRELCLTMAEKQPGLVHDIMHPPTQQGGYHPQPGGTCPNWCVCGNCRQMPTEREKVCCGKEQCITLLPDFSVLILDEAVLALARLYKRDILIFNDEVDERKGNRHQAYRQYILWTYGRLGAGDRRVIPSCAVWSIRDKFPDPFGQYTGFVAGRI